MKYCTNGYSILERKKKMIPSPDFRLDISITIAEEVIKLGCATIGFVIAMWAVVKMTQILFGNRK
jgi:hypothetical protein